MSDLTPEQEGRLEQFKEVTAYPPEDQEKVARLLQVCNWNLDTAISRYFDNDFPTLLDDQSLAQNQQQQPQVQPEIIPNAPQPTVQEVYGHGGGDPFGGSTPFMDLVPRLPRAMTIPNAWKFQVGLVKAQHDTRGTILAPAVFILMLVPRFLWAIGFGLDKILGPIFPNLFRLLGYREGPTDLPAKAKYLAKEEVSSYDITGYINSVLGETTDLPIYRGDFNSAFNKCKAELRWLMTILVSSESEYSTKFIKTFLNDSSFIDLVKKYDVVVYVGDVLYPEPHEVGKVYRARAIPYVNLIANVSATGTTMPSMSVVNKYQSFYDESKLTPAARKKFVTRLSKVLDRFEPQLVVQRSDKQEADLARALREQQDQAYQDSLKRDREKQEERKRLAAAEQEKLDEEQRKRAEAELKEKQLNASMAAYFASKYHRDTSGWQKGEYTNIQLRNKEGQRTVHKFYQDDTAYDVFMFVQCHIYLKENTEEALLSKDLSGVDITDFVPSFKFDLVSPMPRMRLEPNRTPLKEIAAVWPNGSLLVETTEEEEEEEEEEEV